MKNKIENKNDIWEEEFEYFLISKNIYFQRIKLKVGYEYYILISDFLMRTFDHFQYKNEMLINAKQYIKNLSKDKKRYYNLYQLYGIIYDE